MIATLAVLSSAIIAISAVGYRWRRDTRQDRYMDRLLERAWEDPKLLWQHPVPKRRRFR